MKVSTILGWTIGLSVMCALQLSVLANEPKVQARVEITSQPKGATVIIDGTERGETPVTLYDLAPGRHHLKYRLAGYEDRDRFFDMSEGPFIKKHEVLEDLKGLLLLKSEPAGCDIQIDGVSIGQTPRLITTLSARETYKVKLRKEGFQDQIIDVNFNGRRPLVREEKMVSSSGTIIIASDPIGAMVTVNGIERGPTPVTVSQVPRGQASVRFRLNGFAEEVRELSVSAGDVQTLAITMKALPGTLHLISNPEGARFYINEEARGKGPVVVTGLQPGEYTVRAELVGYAALTKTIVLGNGEAVREEFQLSNMMGRLELRSTPPGAQVFLDGHLVGRTRAKEANAVMSDVFSIDDVMEGKRSLVLKMDGYADYRGIATITNQQTFVVKKPIALQRIFTPDYEIVTARSTYQGVLVAIRSEGVELEIKPGITQTIPTSEIRRSGYINEAK